MCVYLLANMHIADILVIGVGSKPRGANVGPHYRSHFCGESDSIHEHPNSAVGATNLLKTLQSNLGPPCDHANCSFNLSPKWTSWKQVKQWTIENSLIIFAFGGHHHDTKGQDCDQTRSGSTTTLFTQIWVHPSNSFNRCFQSPLTIGSWLRQLFPSMIIPLHR